MPIWNPKSDEIDFSIILNALENIDWSGVAGFPKLPYTRAATVEFDDSRSQIIPSTPDVIREIFIRNTSKNPLTVFFGKQEIALRTLLPGQVFWDSFNSGLPIEAITTGTIEIIIRADS